MTSPITNSKELYKDLANQQVSSDLSIVILTGASTGIGYASASYLAERKFFVIATVRKTQDAERLTKLHSNIFPILLDVCFPDQVDALAVAIDQFLHLNQRPYLDALINNAGIALGGPLVELDDQVLQQQLEVNVVAPMRMIRALAPALGVKADSKQGGRIIQVSSISGERAMPFVGPYTASKFALEGISDSLRMELLPFGVDVIIVQPGPINTEIWDKAPTPEENPFKDGLYAHALKRFYEFIVQGGRKGLAPVEIAKVIHKALIASKPKTRYVKTPGFFIRVFLPKRLPTRVFDRLIGKLLGLLPQSFHEDSSD